MQDPGVNGQMQTPSFTQKNQIRKREEVGGGDGRIGVAHFKLTVDLEDPFEIISYNQSAVDN